MAGAASEDDAVALNVTPLIDIIFCLCLFFLAGFHFKQLQGKLDSWLPKNGGVQQTASSPVNVDEVRVFLRSTATGTELAFGSRIIGVVDGGDEKATFDELQRLIVAQVQELSRGKEAPNVVIDGEPRVPWRHVIAVLDRCKRDGIEKVEFAQPLPTGVNVPR